MTDSERGGSSQLSRLSGTSTANAPSWRAEIAPHEAEAWLAPARAYMLRATQPIPAEPLSPGRQQMIKDVLAETAADIPAWKQLLFLPVRYALLKTRNGAISASSRAWPQHILLADAAFSSAAELREQTLHELTHQWLYLIQEVWRLQAENVATFTLPSGTRPVSPLRSWAPPSSSRHCVACTERCPASSRPNDSTSSPRTGPDASRCSPAGMRNCPMPGVRSPGG